MKVSLNWLREYVDIRIGVGDLANLLTMAGLEVERIRAIGDQFERVTVGRIRSIRKHPNADRLTLVEVETGEKILTVVCGATNIREGQKVPLALDGARLSNGAEIRRSKIRGEVSEGMLCSEKELGLGEDASGIMILPPDTPTGVNLGDLLGMRDTILEINITPNRPDCLSMIGIAREIAALTGQKVRYPEVRLPDSGDEIKCKTSVTIVDPDLCPRYVARIIEGVEIKPSPRWIKNRLESAGIRSINNVVDVTNYVMLECGQPLHAFDFDLLEERRIVVRRAREGESFVTLDGVRRVLDPEMLMICDGVKPVAIAGVMGGMNSEIRNDTKTVFLESAYFEPSGNRRTSLKLGLETEAAYRFGRGVDCGGVLIAANRAAQLIQELSGGRVVEGALDVYPSPMRRKPIVLSIEKSNRILGTNIPPQRIKAHLRALELEVEERDGDLLVITPPTFRRDLEREIDLVEEIARLEGYEKIPVTLPRGAVGGESGSSLRRNRLEKKVRDVLLHHGYQEVITYSFIDPSSFDRMNLPPNDQRRDAVKILNPLSEELSVMRTSLIPGLMETVRYNLSLRNENLKLFELRKTYHPEKGEKLPRERKILAGVATGHDRSLHWASRPRPVDFYDVKGCVEDLLRELGINSVRFLKAEDVPYLHSGKAARVVSDTEALGVVGEVHPEVLLRFEIEQKVYIFELDFELMTERADDRRRFKPMPKFPAVYRDLSLVVDEELEAGKVIEAIRGLKHPFIDTVTLFDLYRGAPIPEGKKGITCRIRYQSYDRTLKDDEVNRYHEFIVSRLREIFHADLR